MESRASVMMGSHSWERPSFRKGRLSVESDGEWGSWELSEEHVLYLRKRCFASVSGTFLYVCVLILFIYR